MAVKLVRTNGHDEIVARTNNLLVGRAAFETARRLYPHERVDYRDGSRIIALVSRPMPLHADSQVSPVSRRQKFALRFHVLKAQKG